MIGESREKKEFFWEGTEKDKKEHPPPKQDGGWDDLDL